MFLKEISECIGRTPMIPLTRLSPDARILAKLEFCNPGGSAKDRIALAMLDRAEAAGLLHPGSTVIEPTSGNTGIALAMLCAQRGYRCVIVMPDTMSRERRLLMEAYGAQVILTPGHLGMAGAVSKADALAHSIPNCYIPNQFLNPANPQAHYATTGPEIWEETNDDLDIFVAGIGTGGTVTGAGRYLKERNPNIRIVGVEPASSPLLSRGRSGTHKIQGIGANFVPDTLDRSVIDEIVTVSDEQAFETARLLARQEGILAGISSGAAVAAAISLAQCPDHAEKTIAVILPDSGRNYLFSGLFPGNSPPAT